MSDSSKIKSTISCHIDRRDMNNQGGCLSKLPALDLIDLLRGASNLSISATSLTTLMEQPEDCSVVDSLDQQLLVTTDIGPLVGTDLRRAGRIAALNAVSDIYACGGRPVWALVTMLVGRQQPEEYRELVLAGILDACYEEKIKIIGGHTIFGQEMMAGLTVGGNLNLKKRMLKKIGAKLSDKIFISKSLGSGIALSAYKVAAITKDDLEEAMAVMLQSNRIASNLAVEVHASAVTDITGFGFLGHLSEMLIGGLGAKLHIDAIPRLSVLSGLPENFGKTVSIRDNLAYVNQRTKVLTNSLIPAFLLDPQTNGGLIIIAGPDVSNELTSQGIVEIGKVTGTGLVELY